MVSKRYIGKVCAYCGKEGAATTADHVIAREFFFRDDRGNLPQVPACNECNNDKSKLEHYVTAALMAGSRLAEGDRYRSEMVSPRLAKNQKLAREMGIGKPPVWTNVNGILQPMHELIIDPNKINQLMGLIAKGLYFHHFGKPLSSDFYAEAKTIDPNKEAALWASMADYFPVEATRVGDDLGNGTFVYAGARSTANEFFSAWQMAWHNGIPLHGGGAPPQGIAVFWVVTRPTPEAVARANRVKEVQPSPSEGPAQFE